MRRFFAIVGLVVFAGCSLNNMPSPVANYRPVPDARLYASVADISGVTSVDLTWTNGFDNPNGYGGDIRVRRDVDVVEILDRALAILRQGRPGASLGGIQVAPEGAFAISPTDFGLWTESDFTARYGHQPGSGLPPPTPLRRTR